MERTARSRWTLTAFLWAIGLSGCSLWPFADRDRTSYVTPSDRVAAVEEIGRQATGSESPEQEQLALQLARQIQTEEDPLVREAIVRAASQFRTPMADRMLVAALNDSDPYVRQTACKLIGRRQDASAVAALGEIARTDDDVDVRLAATRALGELRHPSAVEHLSSGLHESDPAIQLATVESLQLVSGEDLGGDVGAWREWVASRQHGGRPAAVAGRTSFTPPP